jgi:hypothetical protein
MRLVTFEDLSERERLMLSLRLDAFRLDTANRRHRRHADYAEQKARAHEILGYAEEQLLGDDVFDTFFGDTETVDWVLGEWAGFVFERVRAFEAAVADAATFEPAPVSETLEPEDPGPTRPESPAGPAPPPPPPLKSSPVASCAPPGRALSRPIREATSV